MRRFVGLVSLVVIACGSDAGEESGTGTGSTASAGDASPTASTAGAPTTSGSGSGSDTGSAPAECPAEVPSISTPEALAETLAAILCEKAAACGCSEVPADCAAQEIEGTLKYYEAHLELGLSFDPACAGLLALHEEWQSCEYDTPSPCPACAAFVGTLAEGEACEIGTYGLEACAGSLGCVMGRCTPLVEVGVGETCVAGPHQETVALCPADHYCRPATDVCTRYPAIGEPCIDGTCGPEGWCDGSQEPDSLCALKRAAGSACESAGQCQSSRCQDGACLAHPVVCKLVMN